MDKVGNINIHYFPSSKIWQEASKFLVDYLKDCLDRREKTLLLLSGGSSVNLYKPLANFIQKSNINFDFLALGQVDERFQPEKIKHITYNKEHITNKNINANAIGETGLWRICKEKGIPYYLISQKGTLERAAEEYNQTISKLFKQYPNGAAVLGIGEDCHTAGLLPGYSKLWNINKFVVGYENNGQFPRRISITPKALRQLNYAIIVALGENKKKAIQNALKKENINNLNKFPAVLIRIIRNVDLFSNL